MEGNLYFEDLQVGQRFICEETTAVTAEQIKEFAREYDPQPFHVDEEAAADSLFGGLAASGWHTAVLTIRRLVGGLVPIAGGLIGGGVQVDWPQPMRPGDELRVASEVMEMRPSNSKPERGWVTVRTETRNQRDELLQVITARLVVPRRPLAQE